MGINPFDAAILAYDLAGINTNGTNRSLMSDPYGAISAELLGNDTAHRANILAGQLAKYNLTADAAIILQVDTTQPIPPPPKPRYVIHSAEEAILQPPVLEHLVEDFIALGNLGIVFGDAGAGKTMAMLFLGVCIAMGVGWLGHAVMQGIVLLIDEESGYARTARRIAQVMRGLGAPVDIPFHFVSLASFNFSDPQDVAELDKILDAVKPGILFIDSLMDIFTGDENSAQDVKPILLELKRQAEKRHIAIILIHHSSKAGNYRGSSAIKGIPDLLVKIEAKDDLIEFTSEKNRDGEPFKFSAVMTWTPDSFDPDNLTFRMASTATKAKVKTYSKSQQYVLQFIEDNGPSVMADIKSHADQCSPAAAERAVYDLVKECRLRRCDGGKQGETATWDLVPDKEPIDAAMAI